MAIKFKNKPGQVKAVAHLSDGYTVMVVGPEGEHVRGEQILAALIEKDLDITSHTKQELLDLGLRLGFTLDVSMSNTKAEIDAALRAALA